MCVCDCEESSVKTEWRLEDGYYSEDVAVWNRFKCMRFAQEMLVGRNQGSIFCLMLVKKKVNCI